MAPSGPPTARGREGDRGRVRRRRQRLCRPSASAASARCRSSSGCSAPAGALDARGRRAHPQPRPGHQRHLRGRARPVVCARGLEADALRRKLEPPHGVRPCPRGSIPASCRRTCSTSTTRDRARRASDRGRTRSGRPTTAQADRPALRRSGSNNWAIAAVAHRHRPPDPRQRPAPRARRAVAALHRPPRCAGPRRHRRRRAGAARHLDRPQRHHRLRPHHLRHRPGGPLRLRDASRATPTIPLRRRLGADARRPRDRSR